MSYKRNMVEITYLYVPEEDDVGCINIGHLFLRTEDIQLDSIAVILSREIEQSYGSLVV